MFWGVTLETGKRYSQTVEQSYHLTMAALEPPSSDGKKPSKYVSVMVEHQKSEFMICTLEPERNLQVPLDHMFVEGEEVTYFLNGDGTVHLTGYLVPDYGDDYEDFDEDMEDEEEDEEESEEEEDSIKVTSGKRKNEAIESSPEALGKKAKVDSKPAKELPNKSLNKVEEKELPKKKTDEKAVNANNKNKNQNKLNAKNARQESDDSEDEDESDEDEEESDENLDESLGLIDKEAVEAEDSEDDEEDEEEDEEDSADESDDGQQKKTDPNKGKPNKQNEQKQQNKNQQKSPQDLQNKSPQNQNQHNKQKQFGSAQKGGFQGNQQKGGQFQKGQWNQSAQKNQSGQKNQFGGNQNQNQNQNQKGWQNKKQFGGQNQGKNQQFGGQRGGQQQQNSPNFKGKQSPNFKGQQRGNFNQTPNFNQKDDKQPKTNLNQQKLSGGIIIEDLREGSGPEAQKGKFIHVNYIGRLTNNKEFDRSGNKPFSFKLGRGEVIKGWDIGLEGMKSGGKRRIIVPPNMGYGNRPVGQIPSNSTLHFDVELKSVT